METVECIILALDKAVEPVSEPVTWQTKSTHRGRQATREKSWDDSGCRGNALCSSLATEHLAQEHFGNDGGFCKSCCPWISSPQLKQTILSQDLTKNLSVSVTYITAAREKPAQSWPMSLHVLEEAHKLHQRCFTTVILHVMPCLWQYKPVSSELLRQIICFELVWLDLDCFFGHWCHPLSSLDLLSMYFAILLCGAIRK